VGKKYPLGIVCRAHNNLSSDGIGPVYRDWPRCIVSGPARTGPRVSYIMHQPLCASDTRLRQMPFVDLPNAHDDYASLWYITNSPTGTVGSFDPARATIVLLHPMFLDSVWLTAQFEDPRLTSEYNLIAFDARHAGRTTSRLNAAQDGWTDAADLAFALQALCIPRAHVWACELFATTCALRFAAM
jgi:pimeloyl-ACP methyl ester carboxylesterase